MSKYYFNAQNYFVIEEYDKVKTFSSFLSGIAGLKGIPMWTFYVNRGQAISSFGIRDKNSPIMEFSPANIAYKTVATSGFRTFIKFKKTNHIYEPFHPTYTSSNIIRNMYMKPNEIMIEEINHELGLEIRVVYFNMPNESFAALVRKVEITNRSNESLSMEVLDGMPELLPFGVETHGYKEMGYLLRSWMEVYNLENKIPYFKLRASTSDEAEVDEVSRGHFMVAFSNEEQLITPIVDFELIFGPNTSLLYPDRFAEKSFNEIIHTSQITANKVPCAFFGVDKELRPNETLSLCSIIGHISDIKNINKKAHEIIRFSYIERKRAEANQLIEDFTKSITTKTDSSLFDAYCKQSYLDNLLRGGYPLILGNEFVYHIFSRKHGDLERDYNFFVLEPEFYSQGNGNFRDCNQNRRNDIFFNSAVGNFNVKMFMSLIQIDGYNPLSVEGCTFEVCNEYNLELDSFLNQHIYSKRDEFKSILSGKFTPGKILHFLMDHHVHMDIDEDRFINKILSISSQNIEASFSEGYWIDHWTYNLDLVESYLKVYPDHFEEFLFNDKSYKYYDSPVFVLPRDEKFVIAKDKVRQYGSILEDVEKIQALGINKNKTNWLKTKNGRGEIYYTNLYEKLLALALIKFATMDPYGMGIEMEANKPGWNDAMNGLPGLLGSGLSETFELKKLIHFIVDAMDQASGTNISLPIEIFDLFTNVYTALEKYNHGNLDDFGYWDQVSTDRESFREKIRYGIEGTLVEVSLSEIKKRFNEFQIKIDSGIEKALKYGNGIYPTYFYYDADQYEVVKDHNGNEKLSNYGLPKAKVKSFKVFVLPHFLEGPVKAFKTIKNREEAKSLYQKIKESDLYDSRLGMYKTSVQLDEQSHEIGRIRAFTAGWLERESIFMHMEYKYLYELLKAGLYEEFFDEMRSCLVPFLDPEVYGRSTLEHSSFIASSLNPDPNVHGVGFYARLSGSTAEFLSMWFLMMVGKKCFRIQKNELCLEFDPILPAWLFSVEGKVNFTFLGSVEVIYHNSKRLNTYGEKKVSITEIKIIMDNDECHIINGGEIRGHLARKVRNGQVKKIDLYLN